MVVTPRLLFRTFAIAEFITWALLIGSLILRAQGVNPVVTLIAGSLHGFIFLCYGASTIFVWINERWRAWVGTVGLITTLIPFATLPFELTIDRRGLLSKKWRLGEGGDTPHNFFEHVQAWILRHPVFSVIAVLALIVIVFTVLLILGPPIPRD